MTSTAGGAQWTLQLHPNIQFSDGTAFDANAVMYNWQRIQNPANHALAAASTSNIQTMNVTDPVTLQITLKTPDPNFNYRVAENLAWIASPTALQREGTSFGTHPVGAGPFLVQSYVYNSETILARNPTYWQKGLPYLNEVVIKDVFDSTQAFNTLTSGGADMILGAQVTNLAQATSDGLGSMGQTAVVGGWAMLMNNSKPPFNSPQVREAMALALNRQQYNQAVNGGAASLSMSTLTLPGTPYYDSSLTLPQTNLAQAQTLINQYVAQTGSPVKFTFINSATGLLTNVQEVVAQLEQLKNVQVSIESVSSPVAQQDYATGAFQAALSDTDAVFVPSTDLSRYYLSTSPSNVTRFNDPAVDTLLKQLSATSDPQMQKQLESSIEQGLLKDNPEAWLTPYTLFYFYHKNVMNLQLAYNDEPLLGTMWIAHS
jgi:peptide/nickel transport system substrate-binding protein